jgi:voltage-gated potassium channel
MHRYAERDSASTWAIVDGLSVYNASLGMHNIKSEGVTFAFCYVRAVHFTITTLSTVGYGDIRPYGDLETTFELIVVVTSACIFASIIGSIAAYFANADTSGQVAFKADLRKMKRYMKYREIPDALQTSILNHFFSLYQRQQGHDMDDILNVLPLPLRLKIALHVHRDVIMNVNILRLADRNLQSHVAMALKPQVCMPGDYIYRAGDIGREVYLVNSGKVIVSYPDKKFPDVTLPSGGIFGNYTLNSVSGARRSTARALTNCDLFLLPKHKLEDIVQLFPEQKNRKGLVESNS